MATRVRPRADQTTTNDPVVTEQSLSSQSRWRQSTAPYSLHSLTRSQGDQTMYTDDDTGSIADERANPQRRQSVAVHSAQSQSIDSTNENTTPRSIKSRTTGDDNASVATSATASKPMKPMSPELVAALVTLRTSACWIERFTQEKNKNKIGNVWDKLVDELQAEHDDAKNYKTEQFQKRWNNLMADYKKLDDATLGTGGNA